MELKKNIKIEKFFCWNEQCPEFLKKGQSNIKPVHYDGKHNDILYLKCNICGKKFSENIIKTRPVNQDGIVVQYDNINSTKTYKVLFPSNENEEAECFASFASIVKIGSDCYAQFDDPINEQILMTMISYFYGNILYDFDFNYFIETGNIHFWTNPEGDIISTIYTLF